MPSKDFPWGLTFKFNGTPGSKDFKKSTDRESAFVRYTMDRERRYTDVKKLPKFKD